MATNDQGGGQRVGVFRQECRILLVEDHQDTRRLLGLILERQGHTVVSVATLADAREAIALAAARLPFELMVADLELPDGRGEPLIGEFKAAFPSATVIVSSGHAYPVDRERAKAAGADAFLVKPFTLDQLEAAVNELADCPAEPSKPQA